MYFKILSIAFGVVVILKGPVMRLLARRWSQLGVSAVYPEKQSFRVWATGVAGVVLIAVTWWMHLTRPVPWSLIVTVVVTLTLVKLSQVLFNYRRFRAFVLKVMKERPGYITVLDAAVGVLGGALVLLGIFVYR